MAAGVTQIVDLVADVLPQLNMTAVPDDGGTELEGFIAAATVVIEDIVGHVVGVQQTELYDGGDVSIWLRQLPVISVDAMTEVIGQVSYTLTNQPVGSPVDSYGYSIDDLDVGRITRRSAGSMAYRFWRNTANISVTYTAGRLMVPANIRMAMLELVDHMYVPSQEAFGAPSSFVSGSANADTAMVATPAGYLVPNRVWELCQSSPKPIVFA